MALGIALITIAEAVLRRITIAEAVLRSWGVVARVTDALKLEDERETDHGLRRLTDSLPGFK
jgi:hypothetical protein